jgi:agmatine/peptidylarginine deiminase
LAVHTNFYIANGVVPVPVYGDVNEEENLVVIARLASIRAINSYDKTKDDGPMGLV